jgi:diaminohydroxyphosphoribosylaminopyrimidine deaminase / 5-amino-6-(5-phosphoribosylamino)uracil reductase
LPRVSFDACPPSRIVTASSDDLRRMRQALALAVEAIGLSDPNPRVGCVIVAADGGRVLGGGHTQQSGGLHAEAQALAAVQAAGHDPRGATAYVTLEPCAHQGRTPPCAAALAAAGIARVVTIGIDPNPLVNGRGLALLREAGAAVHLVDGGDAESAALRTEARTLNIGFFSRMLRRRPWVRLKIAASLDGRTALPNGRSQWITGEAARADGHAWRRRASAVLTGIGTVLADNPRLDVRHVPTMVQPLRVVLDSSLRTPLNARLLDAPGGALLYAVEGNAPRAAALRSRGAEVTYVAEGADGHTDLDAVLADLAVRGVNELHIEAGARLNGALLQRDLVDELLLYLAPMLLGQGAALAMLPAPADLVDADRFRFGPVSALGPDLRIVAERDRPLPF